VNERTIAIVGLGYVGLPVALSFARKFPGTIGFDIDLAKVERLRAGNDTTGETEADELNSSTLHLTAASEDLAQADFFVVAVPTPVDELHTPDLRALRGASSTVGKVLKKGDIVVFESTVYPGVTEDICGPILEAESGLRSGVDFFLGYSPERINPGDREHTFERIVKVVSGQDEATLNTVADVYSSVVDAGVHRAASIKVAEAAKVIENTQRDLNIALMNELAILFDRIGIRSKDVLDAARTKWNFLPFVPGLVGGHCIGVDPYYLTSLAEQVGLHPQVILAGRRINDGMGAFVARRTIKMLIQRGRNPKGARVAVLGVTFKEDVPDTRNSRVPDILTELREYGIEAIVVDPVADRDELRHEYGLQLQDLDEARGVDAAILAVCHQAWGDLGQLVQSLDTQILVDVKSAIDPAQLPKQVDYWSL